MVPTGPIILGTTPLETTRWTTSTVTGAEGSRQATFPTRRRTPCQRSVKHTTMLLLQCRSLCGTLPVMHPQKAYSQKFDTFVQGFRRYWTSKSKVGCVVERGSLPLHLHSGTFSIGAVTQITANLASRKYILWHKPTSENLYLVVAICMVFIFFYDQ